MNETDDSNIKATIQQVCDELITIADRVGGSQQELFLQVSNLLYGLFLEEDDGLFGKAANYVQILRAGRNIPREKMASLIEALALRLQARECV